MIIRNKHTGKIIFNDVNLRNSNLRHVDLCDADLRNANLYNANLCNANLCDANLCDADLRYADLRNANLYNANLCNADLRNANLCNTNLCNANLYNANLCNANLRYANCINLQCPEEGSFIGWKKCRGNVIVKLLILEDSLRSSATSRKCRASKVKVLEISNGTIAMSTHDQNFTYEVGKTYIVDDFNTDRWNECTSGIHFFITKQEAIEY